MSEWRPNVKVEMGKHCANGWDVLQQSKWNSTSASTTVRMGTSTQQPSTAPKSPPREPTLPPMALTLPPRSQTECVRIEEYVFNAPPTAQILWRECEEVHCGTSSGSRTGLQLLTPPRAATALEYLENCFSTVSPLFLHCFSTVSPSTDPRLTAPSTPELTRSPSTCSPSPMTQNFGNSRRPPTEPTLPPTSRPQCLWPICTSARSPTSSLGPLADLHVRINAACPSSSLVEGV